MQKKKMLRSAAAVLLAGAMLTGVVSANWQTDSTASAVNVGGEAGARNHVLENLADYLYMFDYDMDGVSISEIYPIYTFGEADSDTDFYICYVIKDGEVIADLAISEKNGSYYSTFELCENTYADIALENNTPISFAADGENLYMVSGESACVISSEVQSVGETYSTSELSLPAITQSVMTVSEIPQTCSVQASDDVITRKSYRVPKVANSSTYDTDGQCWAACVASKVMYEIIKYNNANLTSDIVYKAVENAYGKVPSGRDRYIQGLAVYGINAYQHDRNILLSASDLVDKADDGNMTIFRIKRIDGKNTLFFSQVV